MNTTTLLLSLLPLTLPAAAVAQDEQILDVEVEVTSSEDGPVTVAGTVRGADLAPDPERENVFVGEAFGVRYEVEVTPESATFAFARGENPMSEPVDGEKNRGTWVFAGAFPLGHNRGDIYVRPTPVGPRMTIGCQSMNYLFGEVTWNDQDYYLIAVDMDWNGSYGGPNDYWHFMSIEQLASKDSDGFSSNNLIEFVEGRYLGTDRVDILGMKGENVRFRLRAGPASDTREDSMRRRHRRLMDRFVEFSGDTLDPRIDTSRERVEETITWRYVFSPEELDALLAESDKPLLVDGETDWCHWCHVMDATTMKDREVFDRINTDFVPVKANFDFATRALAKRLEVQAYPTYLVVTTGGVKHRAPGFQKPQAFLAFLKEGLDRANAD